MMGGMGSMHGTANATGMGLMNGGYGPYGTGMMGGMYNGGLGSAPAGTPLAAGAGWLALLGGVLVVLLVLVWTVVGLLCIAYLVRRVKTPPPAHP